MMAWPNFSFGGSITTPEQAERQRSIAAALIGQSATPGNNWTEGLADIAAAISGTVLDGRVAEAEAAGRERAGGLFANLAMNSSPDAIAAALMSPDAAWATDNQTSIASALLNRGLEQADPLYQMQLERGQIELDALRNPAPSLYDANAPSSFQEFQLAQAVPEYAETLVETPDVQDQFGNEKDLYAQYAASDPVKIYETVKGGYERVRQSAALQSGAGDMGLIYGYMKMLDPGSVVRESEFAMAAQAGSYGEQIQGLVSRLVNGERLPETVRQQFVQAADGIYTETAANLGAINDQFSTRAQRYGVDPTMFIRSPESYSPIQGIVTMPNGNTVKPL